MVPSAIIASTSESIKPDEIIQGILNIPTLPEPGEIIDEVRCFPWHINTKYYEADIQICALDKKKLVPVELAETVQAEIICFDSKAEAKLGAVDQLRSYTKGFEAEVKILVCRECAPETSNFSNSSSTTSPASHFGVTKVEAQNWCIRHGFELVELNPPESDADSDVEDDFPESVGMKRIVEALHAFQWPNLTLKSAPKSLIPSDLQGLLNGIKSSTASSSMDTGSFDHKPAERKISKVKPMPKVTDSDSSSAAIPQDRSQLPTTSKSSLPTPEAGPCSDPISFSTPSRAVGVVLPFQQVSQSTPPPENLSSQAEALASNNVPPTETHPPHTRTEKNDAILEALDSMPEDNFEQLFQNLSEMKSKAANLSQTDRKAYAEKMAIAFWRSVGGNESEIGNLGSGEESDN